MDLRSVCARSIFRRPSADMLRGARYRFDTWSFTKRLVSHCYGPYQLTMNIHDRVRRGMVRQGLGPAAGVRLPGAARAEARRPHLRSRRARNVDRHAAGRSRSARMARSIAVEANPHNAEVGAMNLSVNGVGNVHIVHGLISSTNGQERTIDSFNSSRAIGSGGAGRHHLRVDSLSIDELSRRAGTPDVVYMDIEGFEIEALKGAQADHRAALHLADRTAWRRDAGALWRAQQRRRWRSSGPSVMPPYLGDQDGGTFRSRACGPFAGCALLRGVRSRLRLGRNAQ